MDQIMEENTHTIFIVSFVVQGIKSPQKLD